MRNRRISNGVRWTFRNRSWAREHLEPRDEAWFKREVAPKLDAFYAQRDRSSDGIIARSLLAD